MTILCFISSIECVIWLPEVRATSEHRACAHTFQIFLQQTKKKSLKIMIVFYKSNIKLDTVTAVRYRVIEHLGIFRRLEKRREALCYELCFS